MTAGADVGRLEPPIDPEPGRGPPRGGAGAGLGLRHGGVPAAVRGGRSVARDPLQRAQRRPARGSAARLLRHCGLPVGAVPAALRAFERDSQAGLPIARAPRAETFTAENRDRFLATLARHPRIRSPDLLLPDVDAPDRGSEVAPAGIRGRRGRLKAWTRRCMSIEGRAERDDVVAVELRRLPARPARAGREPDRGRDAGVVAVLPRCRRAAGALRRAGAGGGPVAGGLRARAAVAARRGGWRWCRSRRWPGSPRRWRRRARLVFVHNIGRCGSTLINAMLNEVDGVWSLSEPDVYLRAGDAARPARSGRAAPG